jgi:membrane fusion protein (multidrug efflux system)
LLQRYFSYLSGVGLPIFLLACTENTSSQPDLETVPVTQVVSIDTNLYTDYVAEIAAVQNVEIRAKVSGYLEKIYVDEGQYVREGQLLFKINEAGYREELNRTKAVYRIAAAEARSAEIELTNVSQLHRKNVVASTELEIAKNKFASATAKVEEALANEEAAEHKLSYTNIRAPFNGFINRIPFKIGSLIDEGSLLTSISENNQVFAYFDVSEKEYLAYAENLLKDSTGSKKVDLILADGKVHDHKGRIETMEGEIDGSTGNIAFRARFPNPDKILKHGASGKVRMTKRLINVLAIPQKATFEVQDKLYVYVVTQDNKLEIRNITASNRLSHIFIISKGLKDKERIVYEGIQNVNAGDKIQPRFISMNNIIKDLASK